MLKVLFYLIVVLVRVAFITLLERKFLRLVGIRLGPNKVTFIGFLQPLGDAVKLANKQRNFLSNYSFFFYYLSACWIIFGSLVLWRRYPWGFSCFSFKFSILTLFVILSINSFFSVLAGWRTFSKYSLIGRVRTVAQLISYESSLYLCLFSLIFLFFCFRFYSFSFELFYIAAFFLPPFFYIWVPSFLAELNRTPYDFSEGERELVRGYNTEFGSSGFTLLFLAEYSNIVFFCALTSLLFFGGVFVFLFLGCIIFVIWIRSVLPRYRFDKLISLAWTFFIPFLTCIFLCLIGRS